VRPLPIMTTALLLATLALVGVAAPPAKPAPAKEDLNTISLDVQALQLLHQLDLTPAQLDALARLAGDTAGQLGDRKPAKASDKYRKLLADLRDAYLKDDDDRINELSDQKDELEDSESPDLNDDIDLTDGARKQTPSFIRLLSPRQVVSYLALYEDDLADPRGSLLDALDKSRTATAAEWKELREDLTDVVGWQVAGLDTDKADKINDKVGAFLDKVKALEDADFKAQRDDLEKEARNIIGDIGPTEVLRHVLEQDVAELLSNPRLPDVLAARLKNAQK
jgi:hypothetical protein